MNQNIEDNPSFKKFRENIEGFELIKNINEFIPFLKLSKNKDEDIFENFTELKNQPYEFILQF